MASQFCLGEQQVALGCQQITLIVLKMSMSFGLLLKKHFPKCSDVNKAN